MSSASVAIQPVPVTRSASKRLAVAVDAGVLTMSKKLKTFSDTAVTKVLPNNADSHLVDYTVKAVDLDEIARSASSGDNPVTAPNTVSANEVDMVNSISDNDDVPPLEDAMTPTLVDTEPELKSDSDISKGIPDTVSVDNVDGPRELQGRMMTIRLPALSKTVSAAADTPPITVLDSDDEQDEFPVGDRTKPEPRSVARSKRSYRDNLADFVNPGFLTDESLRRIAGISLRGNQYAYRYPLSNLPLMAKWGSTGNLATGQEDRSRLLTVHNTPLRVTVTGKVVKANFFGPNGDPQPRVSIGITPLRVQDLLSYNALLNNKSDPCLAEERDVIYAGKFQTQRIRDRQAPICLPYSRVFDMQVGPTRKRSPKSAAMIAKDDVVMLECYVNRYRPSNANGGKRSSKAWDCWMVGLELIDILYLAQAPEVKVEAVTIDVDGEEEY